MRHIGLETQQNHRQDVAFPMLGDHLGQLRAVDFLDVQVDQQQIRPKAVNVLEHLQRLDHH